MISISVETQIDSAGLAKAVERNEGLWLYAAVTWHKLYSPYVPFQTGTLANSVTITPGQIVHNVPYAKRCYNGNFDFRRDKHPLATAHWDEAAEQKMLPKLAKSLQAYVNFGGLKI